MASQTTESTDSIHLQKRHNRADAARALEDGPEDDGKLVGLREYVSPSELSMMTDNGT